MVSAGDGLCRSRFGPRELPAAEIVEHLGEENLIGTTFGQREPDPSHGDADDGSDLEQLQADGVAAGLSQRRVLQSVLPQRLEEDIGRARQPQPELIGSHGLATGAIGEQAELLLLDAVLHLAPGAVQILI